eukprot:2998799-Rhodomonas_salina.1
MVATELKATIKQSRRFATLSAYASAMQCPVLNTAYPVLRGAKRDKGGRGEGGGAESEGGEGEEKTVTGGAEAGEKSGKEGGKEEEEEEEKEDHGAKEAKGGNA